MSTGAKHASRKGAQIETTLFHIKLVSTGRLVVAGKSVLLVLFAASGIVTFTGFPPFVADHWLEL